MRIDGRAIAEEMAQELAATIRERRLHMSLAIIQSDESLVTQKFVAAKRKYAERIGVMVEVVELRPLDTGEELLRTVLRAGRDHDGIIIQLPLPPQFQIETVRQILPITHDVDLLGATAYEAFETGRLSIMPPVVGAIAEIAARHSVTLAGKRTVVVGQGRLVGAPASVWARRMGAQVTAISKSTPDLAASLADAEIVIAGAGAPGLITPEMVPEGIIIFDAGTSEAEGKLAGDADPSCEAKAALFTPTPGGIGPVTIGMIFKNLLALHGLRQGSAQR